MAGTLRSAWLECEASAHVGQFASVVSTVRFAEIWALEWIESATVTWWWKVNRPWPNTTKPSSSAWAMRRNGDGIWNRPLMVGPLLWSNCAEPSRL